MSDDSKLTRRAAIRGLGVTGLASVALTSSQATLPTIELTPERFQPTIDRLRYDKDVIVAVHDDRLSIADELEALIAGKNQRGTTPAIARPYISPPKRIEHLLEEMRVAMSEHYPGACIKPTFNDLKPEHVLNDGSIACLMVLACPPRDE